MTEETRNRRPGHFTTVCFDAERDTLTVQGHCPDIEGHLALKPVIYKERPDYWRIELVWESEAEAHLRMEATRPCAARLSPVPRGHHGIEIIGANRSVRLTLPALPEETAETSGTDTD